MGGVVVKPVRSRRDARDFVRVPWIVYRGDPSWVPPLRISVRHTIDSRKNPFHREATVEHFVACDGAGAPVGRIAVTIHPDYCDRHGAKAFFGFFETVPDERVAGELMAVAEEWAFARGMRLLAGPYSYTSTQETGLLIEGFDRPPALLQAHSASYYPELLDSLGYKKAFEMTAYSWSQQEHGHLAAELVRRGDEAAAEQGLTVRPVDLDRYEFELESLRLLYNKSFSVHPESAPISRAVFQAQARDLRPIVDPRIVRIVERDGRPIAFCLLLPNLNEVLARFNGRLTPRLFLGLRRYLRAVRSVIVVMIGADPAAFGIGVGRCLRGEIVRAGVDWHYDTVHTTWIHQDNSASLALVNRLGAPPTRRYAILEREL